MRQKEARRLDSMLERYKLWGPSGQKESLAWRKISMWSDRYCYIDQCGSVGPNEPVPVGSPV